jgi:hypothetical protein
MHFAEPTEQPWALGLNESDHLAGAQQGQTEVRHFLAAGQEQAGDVQVAHNGRRR